MNLTGLYGCSVTNIATSGHLIANNSAATDALQNLTNSVSAYNKITVVMMMAVNDIGQADSVANVTTNLLLWCNNVKASFPQVKIALMTSPACDTGFDSRLTDVNTWIKNSGASDYVVDLRADSRMQNNLDTTYYQADKVHFTDQGYAVIASIVKSNLVAWGRVNGGENLFLTSSGAGAANGIDWNNAFAGLADITWGTNAGKLGEGDTLWIAGGTYNSTLYLNGSGSAGYVLSLKRARSTNSECSSSPGWSAAYDSQVVINPTTHGIELDSTSPTSAGRYILIDGQVTDGIRINPVMVSLSAGIWLWGNGAFNTTFRNIGIYGPSTNGITGSFTWTQEVVGVYAIGNGGRLTDVTFDKLTIAGVVTGMKVQVTKNIVVENSDMHCIECYSGDPHGNLMYNSGTLDFTIRNNSFHDSMFAVGVFFTYFGDSGVRASNVWIYGNTFRDSYGAADRCIEVRAQTPGVGPLYIYNNTFVNVHQGININTNLTDVSPSYFQNNLFIDVDAGSINFSDGGAAVTSHNIITNSYTIISSAGNTNVLPAPFAWEWVRNLRLAAGSTPINAGTSIGSPVNIDPDGNERGSGGVWDIGAYEYQSPTRGPARAAAIRTGTVILR
jgi:hypothetical protein